MKRCSRAFPAAISSLGGLWPKREVGDLVAVQVAELAPADDEPQAAEAPGAALDPRPALELGGNSVASAH